VEAEGKARRDHIGHTPLHVAIMAGAKDIACNLIDAGAHISLRIVDGRTALHLAVQMDVVRKLL
jgi:ankyrin repeat protein